MPHGVTLTVTGTRTDTKKNKTAKRGFDPIANVRGLGNQPHEDHSSKVALNCDVETAGISIGLMQVPLPASPEVEHPAHSLMPSFTPLPNNARQKASATDEDYEYVTVRFKKYPYRKKNDEE